MRSARRGVILPIVLFILLLLGLLVGVFSFRVHADAAATHGMSERLQTRLAAEAGVEWVKQILRVGRFDYSLWYHQPEAFHRVVVWAKDQDSRAAGTVEEFEEAQAYRFSIVADDPTDDETYIRFGLTDEASKLNLNTATPEQLLRLLASTVELDEETDPKSIVDAIIDWRDPDSAPRGEAGDGEGEYYRRLAKPYRVKNADFDTVEELLLVKGMTSAILYGEDFDRNGLLTDNENDGDASFPADNSDGLLHRGLYPYLTVWAYESNVSNDNRQRVYLFGPAETLRSELALIFPDQPQVVDFMVNTTRDPGGRGGPGGAGGPQSPGGPQGGGPDGEAAPGGEQPVDGAEGDPGGPGAVPGSTPPPRAGGRSGGSGPRGSAPAGSRPPAQPVSPQPSLRRAAGNQAVEKERLLILGSRMAHGVASCWRKCNHAIRSRAAVLAGASPAGESRPAALAVSDRPAGRSAVLRPPMPKGKGIPTTKERKERVMAAGELRRFVPRRTCCCLDASVSSRSKAR